MNYSLSFINDIIINGFEYSLSNETMDIMLNLAQEVGAPNYVKTPVFAKNNNIQAQGQGPSLNHKDKDKKKRKKSKYNHSVDSSSEWSRVEPFHTTVRETSTGTQLDMDQLRLQLNKLTDKNFLDIISKIEVILDNTTFENNHFVGNTIFNLACNNRFYSNIYAQVYSTLMSKYNFMVESLDDNVSNYMKTFDNIQCVDPNIDYDAFCDSNKANESRKALTCFFNNLNKQRIINDSTSHNFISTLVSKFQICIMTENKKDEANEICENISILIDETNNPELILSDLSFINSNSTSDCEESISVKTFLYMVATSKISAFSSLTNKTKYKLMDILKL